MPGLNNASMRILALVSDVYEIVSSKPFFK